MINRIGGTEIPVFADPLLWTQNFDELAKLVGDDAPSHADVAAERQRLVLQCDEDPAQTRIDAVAEGEVDDPVRTTKIHRGFGAFLRQRIEAFTDASGKDHYHYIVEHGCLSV